MKTATVLASLAFTLASLAAGAVGRLADVTVVDRASGRTLPIHWHEGRAYIVGEPGREYSIRVRNRSGEDLLAVTSVDGVNVVSGRTASYSQGGYVVGPWQRTEIDGWRKSLDATASFYFTSLGDSYAGRTGRPDDVGVIGVALFQRAYYHRPEEVAPPERWEPKREAGPSAKEVPQGGRKSMPGAPIGTGHGRIEDSQAHESRFERATETPVETVAIYYDSYRNLVAQGVIRSRYLGRRDPDPFPREQGYVPDPPRYRY